MALRMYFGLQGSGKTYAMFDDLLEHFARKPVQVYTNIESAVIPEAIYFHHIEQLIDLSDGLILLDEVGIVMPAQFWHELGRDLLVRICQMRHDGLDLWYSVQRREGANVNLREQTGEFVGCSRLGPLLWRRTDYGEKRASGGGRLRRLSARVYDLYNTHTNIGRDGGSMERRSGGARSRATQRLAARTREREARRRAMEKPRSLLVYDPLEGLLGGPKLLRPRREAKDCYEWLKQEGYLLAGVHWADQVRAEMARRDWLSRFHLGPDDAPITCRPETPWLDGYDPKSVKRRWEERQAEILAEKLAIQNVSRRRRDAA